MNACRILVALGAAATFATLAAAQTPAPAAAAAPAVVANPANMPKCDKPDAHPGRLASDTRLKAWDKEVRQWQDCMKKGIAELQAKADVAVKSANAAVADANGAITLFNDTVKEFNAQVEATK